jgi:SAM-dependent methyltransferase
MPIDMTLAAFRRAYERDNAPKPIPDWMVSWAALDNLKMDLTQEKSQAYSGVADVRKSYCLARAYQLVRFFDQSLTHPYPGFLDFVRGLIERHKTFDRALLRTLGIYDADLEADIETYAHYTAEDFVFQTMIPTPRRRQIRRIPDYGAGNGRQFSQWSHEDIERFVAVDAVPFAYCVQNAIFGASGKGLDDYVAAPDAFAVDGGDALLKHLPAWRHDLLPSDYFDLVITIMVLPELHPKLIHHLLALFQRVLKPGGAFYVRDWDNSVRHNNLRLTELIASFGFVLEFRPHLDAGKDVYGIPRLWRKREEASITSMA